MMNNTQTIHYQVMLQDKNLLNYNPDTKKLTITQKGKKLLQLCFEGKTVLDSNLC
jgi:predicted transcriptional regulator